MGLNQGSGKQMVFVASRNKIGTDWLTDKNTFTKL